MSAVVAGGALVLAGLSAPQAAAEPVPTTSGSTFSVTLVTGDVVHLERFADGRQAATVVPGPGREHVTFHQQEVDGRLSVLPADVLPRLGDRLDPALFDVTGLAAQGYDGALPLIVTYAEGAPKARGRDLPSINARAVAADAALLADPGVENIRLDRKLRATLEHSVPQIGAPAAWAAGHDGTGTTVAVLDTGYDPTHPDLAGVVTAAENFTDTPDATDRFGHGTHVAATVAGTGAASGGRRKGVAPGADVIVGKVLDDNGSGYESWVLAGMEWAARSGADVVNMSLGADPTDGTDPLSQAVDVLTAETGTLFVVSAGNSGETGPNTIGSPGAASSALTVGAVNRDEKLAYFSSTGPRLGDLAVKPDLTAPGVDIVAARAAGTSMGSPVDGQYTAASGTSMAAPHVAGAAAILAGQHPDWTGQRLKDALVSTAVGDTARSVYEHGAGRVAVDRAVSQGVYATGTLDFGEVSEITTKQVTYVNTTAVPVSLRLSTTTDAVQLGQSTVEVPANGSATATVTADPARLTPGAHGGRLVATAGTITVRTSIGVTETAPTHEITFRAKGPNGEPLFTEYVAVYGADRRQDVLDYIHAGGSVTLSVPEGDNYLTALLSSPDESVSYQIIDPAFRVTGPREYTLDAGRTTKVRVETPHRATQQGIFSFYAHREFGDRHITNYAMKFDNTRELWVTPTAKTTGVLEFGARWSLVAPPLWASAGGLDFEPRYLGDSPRIDGRRTLDLVPAGDFTRVRGKIALVAPDPNPDWEGIAAAAKKGGAVLVLLTMPGVSRAAVPQLPVPMATVLPAEGARLAAALDRGRVRMSLDGTPDSPYLYDVMQVERDRVPREVVHRVSGHNSATVRAEYHNSGGDPYAKEQRFAWRPWQTTAINQYQRIVETGRVRPETVTSGDTIWQHRVRHYRSWESMNPLANGLVDTPRTFRAGERVTESWFAPVVRPAALESTRDGDTLTVRVPDFVDAAGHYGRAEGAGWDDTPPDRTSARLYRNGRLVAEAPSAWGEFAVASERATYRLELTTARATPEWLYATATETAWTFRSQRVEHATLPLLNVDYDVDTDLNNEAARVTRLTFTPSTQADVRAWLSYDDGRTWTEVRLDRRHAATVHHRRGGFVSLKVQATDRAGNSVEQKVLRAYGVR
ncbi:S8 family serine peptidase [Actinophytocola sp.]|uniref:S8 family serine peptidase n=1 Tax=Actinophytocola sp. TaxID=1872138 RepID=UPI002ED49CFE